MVFTVRSPLSFCAAPPSNPSHGPCKTSSSWPSDPTAESSVMRMYRRQQRSCCAHAKRHGEKYFCGKHLSLTIGRLLCEDSLSTRVIQGPAVAERLARSQPSKANRVQSPTGSPDFRKWESCRTMSLVGGFSRNLSSPPPLHSGAAPYSLQSPSSALNTSLLRAAQISSLTKDICLGQYQLGSSLVDDRPIMNAVKYRVVPGVVWTNRTMCRVGRRGGAEHRGSPRSFVSAPKGASERASEFCLLLRVDRSDVRGSLEAPNGERRTVALASRDATRPSHTTRSLRPVPGENCPETAASFASSPGPANTLLLRHRSTSVDFTNLAQPRFYFLGRP
ncbi:hypothetical protein PR048_029441 [Dryococelus australis]|uniref:Uncharacterized protein n=1 Tax=Dryococelus australis TaxID=614101 RepID=A0ABQ9GG61_9NEOP|nr:hypothetical protein PR048_029441 [Dryococelus australis]